MTESNSASVGQSWKDIAEWYKRNAPVQFALLQKGATQEQIAQFEKLIKDTLPDDYKESLLIHDGQPYLSSYQYLSLESVRKRWQSLSDLLEQGAFKKKQAQVSDYAKHLEWWDQHWIPFAEDSGGNLICLSLLDQGPGRIIRWEVEEGPIPTEIVSFGLWLKKYRDDLYNDVYKVDDEGFIVEK